MGRRRRATPYFPLSSSVARVAAHSPSLPPLPSPPRLLNPTHTNRAQTIPNPLLSSLHFFPSFSAFSSLFRSEAFLPLLRRFPRFSEAQVAASRCSNARCYNTSRTRCCRYTFFLPFLFSPPGPLQPCLRESTASLSLSLSLSLFLCFFSIVLRLDLSLPLCLRSLHRSSVGGTETRCIRGAFILPSWQTREHTRAATTGKFLRLSIFWQIATLGPSATLNPEYS